MMKHHGDFDYVENRDFQAIRLPYGNRQYAMYVFLPRETAGLPDFLRSLNETHWKQWTGRFQSNTGEINLPKFETTYSERLNDALKEMGMKLAFDDSRADFSRIPLNPTRGNALYVSEVEHKTWVKVDEEGTEAAAATSMRFALSAGGGGFEMMVDHPFFFAITEQQTGALLFAGVVMDPTLKGDPE